ncbi:MAG: DUF1848 domain-containing protein [Clostridia bacterium]|nr:DUF1848 domain-containing protein [Clostridia bacterium]
MIISASRRTDIPSYYSEWFFNRIKEGYVCVRNPMNIHQVGKISLSPDVVDGIVFWTKNPTPMLSRLDEISQYNYYFQFTVNSYNTDIETNVPSKNDVIIPTFQRLSKQIGKDRVIWRYDPILLNEKYTLDYHLTYFKMMADKLADYTEKCTISFIDIYRNIQKNMSSLQICSPSTEQQEEIIAKFVGIANEYGIYIDTCAEKVDFDKYGVKHAHCIDRERLERIGKYKLDVDKDKNQRDECGCVSSIDIGSYNTCKNGCLYCYANFSQKSVVANHSKHNPNSPLLYGDIESDDVVKERIIHSFRNNQLGLFD